MRLIPAMFFDHHLRPSPLYFCDGHFEVWNYDGHVLFLMRKLARLKESGGASGVSENAQSLFQHGGWGLRSWGRAHLSRGPDYQQQRQRPFSQIVTAEQTLSRSFYSAELSGRLRQKVYQVLVSPDFA